MYTKDVGDYETILDFPIKATSSGFNSAKKGHKSGSTVLQKHSIFEEPEKDETLSSTKHTYGSYHNDLVDKVDTLYSGILVNKSSRGSSKEKLKLNQAFPKVMPRPSSVMTYKKNMQSVRDIRKMREYAQNREYRCLQDLSTFEHYIKQKLVRKDQSIIYN